MAVSRVPFPGFNFRRYLSFPFTRLQHFIEFSIYFPFTALQNLISNSQFFPLLFFLCLCGGEGVGERGRIFQYHSVSNFSFICLQLPFIEFSTFTFLGYKFLELFSMGFHFPFPCLQHFIEFFTCRLLALTFGSVVNFPSPWLQNNIEFLTFPSFDLAFH